jgi:uncharacterized protein (DUF2062 family)/trans-aconitate methyltransferase
MVTRPARRRVERLLAGLRTQGDTPGRQAASFAVGAFIGCTPLYGFHLPLCVAAASILRLNQLTTYLAANLNNPLVAPFLIFAEVQVGAVIRTGHLHPVTLSELRRLSLWDFGLELALGSLIVGCVVAVLGGSAVWLVVRRGAHRDPIVRRLIEDAARPYLRSGLQHWEFVRSKLRWDPVFVHLVQAGDLSGPGTLVDLGCGRGALLSLIRAVDEAARVDGLPPEWPAWSERPTLHGVDSSGSAVSVAREALGEDARVECADLVDWQPPRCRAAILLDVLHYLPDDAQDALLGRIAAALEPGGFVILREADAVGSRAYRLTAAAERLRAVLRGHPRQRFWFRPVADLAARLEHLGLVVERQAMSEGTPFENHLVTARRAEAA